jgi:hypothetical protein
MVPDNLSAEAETHPIKDSELAKEESGLTL